MVMYNLTLQMEQLAYTFCYFQIFTEMRFSGLCNKFHTYINYKGYNEVSQSVLFICLVIQKSTCVYALGLRLTWPNLGYNVWPKVC